MTIKDANNKTPVIASASAALLVAAAAAYGFIRCRYGLGMGDEGHSLSAALRYSLGDIPFRDEVLNPVRCFDIMLAPILRLLPDAGETLTLRRAALAFHLLCYGALLRVFLKDRVGSLTAAAIFFAAVYSTSFSFWTPTYHSASSDFIFLSLALWLAGVQSLTNRKALAFGALSGASLFLAGFCELPLFALIAAPALFAAAALKKNGRSSPSFITPAAIFISCAALAAAAAAALLLSGLLPDLLNALALTRTVENYKVGVGVRVINTFAPLLGATPFLAFHALFWALPAASRFFGSRPLSFLATFAAPPLYAALSFIYIYRNVKANFYNIGLFFEGAVLLALIAAPLVRLIRPRESPDTLRAPMYAFTLLWHCLLLAICSNGFMTASLLTMPLALPLICSAVADISPRARASSGPGAAHGRGSYPFSAPLLSSLVFTGLLFFAANLFSMSNFEWCWTFRREFRTTKLQGIYLTEREADNLEALVEFLGPRIKKGDFLISFYSNPMLHYLTDTRAAMPTGFLTRYWPEKTRARFISDMLKRNRVPKYAVSAGMPSKEPIYDFVRSRYKPLVRLGGVYVVWELRGRRP